MIDFEAWRSYGLLLDAASGLVFLLLGLAVALVRPRRLPGLAFAGFSMGLGWTYLLANLQFVSVLDGPLLFRLIDAGSILIVAGAIVMGLRFPRALRPEERRLAVGAALGSALTLAAATLVFRPPPGVAAPSVYLWLVAWAGLMFFVVLLSARFPTASPREREQIVLVTTALTPWIALSFALLALETPHATPGPIDRGAQALLDGALLGTLLVLWIRNTRVPEREDRLAARRLALLASLSGVAGAALGLAVGPEHVPSDLGILGASRLVAIVVLAYAILRHQIFDLDVKLKVGIQHSTIAAVFIVFAFVVSEIAQEVLSEAVGPYVGIVAAGALLFAIAPLQRLAERVATAAVPGAPAGEDAVRARKLATYRNALQMAWMDGSLSPAERRFLAELREALGLRPEEYDALERELDGNPTNVLPTP